MSRHPRFRRLARAAARLAAAGALAGAAAFAVSWAVVEAPVEASETYPEGLVLRDREGAPLRIRLGPGDVDCRPRRAAPPDEWVGKAIVASEDKRFYRHRGADLLALARAIAQDVVFLRRVSGASTITEQTVRLIEPHPRTLKSKWLEFFQALKIERVRSKDWILAQYLDRAPFGGNYVGIEAAARGWFDKAPGDLSLGEAALLAGMVQAPTRFRPDIHMDRAVKRRDYVLSRMEALGMATPAQVAAARAAAPALVRGRRPFRAPHYCDWAARALVPEGAHDATLPLDPRAQALAEDAVGRASARLGADFAAVVLDVPTGDVVAMACSADYFRDPAGQVNAALSPRPAGSTLKPFFFARALERGLLAPTEVLPDLPKAFGAYLPANFSGGHSALVRADEALVSSLNLPFYEVVRRLGPADALADLRARGLAGEDATPGKHGLGIAVGNLDVSLLALAGAYAAFAREAETNAAARIVSEILSGEARSLAAFGHVADAVLPRAAWKTGTSAAHRDAWTVLWTPGEVVAVRCGHAAGRFGDRSIAGASAAAPVAWEIFRALHPSGDAPWYGDAPPDLVLRRVCAATGLPPSPDCPETRLAWAIAGRTPARPCTVHVRGPDGAVRVRWPASVRAALDAGARPALRFLRPAEGAALRFSGAPPWTVSCTVAGAAAGATLWWTVDGVPAGTAPASRPFAAEVSSPGPHAVSCTAADGASATVRFTVSPAAGWPRGGRRR